MMELSYFECPVCKARLNTNNKPFSSIRSVALHIAGKIKGQCFDHKMRAYENCGQTEIDQALAQARATQGINVLANLMFLPLKALYDEKGRGNIRFKKPRQS